MHGPDHPANSWSERLAATGEVCIRTGFGPDAAAADFIANFAGPPATGRSGDETVTLYPQPDAPALSFGSYGSERRVRGWLPNLPDKVSPRRLSGMLPIQPETVPQADHAGLAEQDLRRLPIPLLTQRDAGKYITMGFVLAREDDEGMALSAHRMLVLGPRRLGLWMLPSRKLRALAAEAHGAGRPLPVSINIGVAPAVAVAASTSSAYLPKQFTKLSLAGALAGLPVELALCRETGTSFLSQADVVILGRIVPETIPEAPSGGILEGAMPEFLGYDGRGQAELSVIEIDRILLRPEAVFQSVVGPGREQSVILGLGGALALSLALPASRGISDLRFSHAGGGMLLLFAALASPGASETRAGALDQLARAMVQICPFTKTVVFVDDDVNVKNDEDVLWAITTRANLPLDCHGLAGYGPLGMDPSQSRQWVNAGKEVAYKSYINATVPARMHGRARRSFPLPDNC